MELLSPEVKKLYFQISPKDEFEIIITPNQINMAKFITLLKYIGYQHSKNNLPIIKETVMDVNLNENNLSYRITVKNKDDIQTVLNNHYQKKNIQVFYSLLQEAKSKISDYDIMIKTRKGIITNDKYKCRLSNEKMMNPSDIKLKEEDRHNIVFRYKQRATLVLQNNEYGIIKLDVTQIQQSSQLSTLITSPITYEAEIDYSVSESVKKLDEKSKEDSINLKNIMNYLKSIIGTLQSSDIIISVSEENQILDNYKKLIYGEKLNIFQDLNAMQSKSLELIPFIDILPNQYSVTDKADGDRHFLFIVNDSVYLINTNLSIRKLNMKVENYNNTIIDGEVIFMNNKQIFLAFDILFDRGIDIRNEPSLVTRYLKLKAALEDITDIKYNWINLDPPEKFDINERLKFHGNNMEKHNDKLLKEINSDKTYIVYMKYFIFPTGGEKSEIYAYSHLMWTRYTTDLKVPYLLDGLIFTGLKQKYTRNLEEIKYQIYKWKPKEKNSIDLYIEFERDSKTKDILLVFDNSNIEEVNDQFVDAPEEKDAVYQVAKLYVGRVNRETNLEIPVPFKPDQELNEAHLFLKDGNVRDVEGNIIQDKTVIEFTYDTVENRDPKKRWIPLRTRYDKTEMVQKFKRKYGNAEKIAESIWQSMNFLIDMPDFKLMGDPATMVDHASILRSKLTAKDIAIYRASDIYYMKKSNIDKTYRYFHNFIKSQYIYNYCSMTQDKKLDIIDIGFGRGGELGKYYHCRVKSITGLDVNADGLFSAGSDSAIGRLNNFRRTKPNFPPTDLVHASFSIPIDDIDQQQKALTNMTDNNKKLLNKVANKKYDVLTSMFMIHYLFKDDISVKNMIYNINKLLKPDGYLLACLFDGDLVNNKFKEKKLVEEYYTTESGEKELLFTLKPLYDLELKNLNKNGLAISFYNSGFMDAGSEFIEYLITPEHFINTMSKAGLELVETETFQTIYELSRDFFFNAINYDAGKDTKGFLTDVKGYYDMNQSINKAAFELTKLYRFYVFRKAK